MGLTYDYVKDEMVNETITNYRRFIPAVFDVEGKKDYTLGVIMPNTVIVPSEAEDGVGEISTTVEDTPSFEDDDL